MARSVSRGELNSSVGSVGASGLALAGQTDGETVEGGGRRPHGSEMWVSDNGATYHVTSYPRFMYDWVEIPPGQEKVLIGDGKEINGILMGSLNLKLHSKTVFIVTLTRRLVTEGIQYNLSSIHEAQGRQRIIMDEDGVHLFDNLLTFLRDSIGSRLYAAPMDPTYPNPTVGLNYVPAMSGVSGPSLGKPGNTSESGVSLTPRLPPPLLLNVDRAGPYPHPLSHHSVEGVVTADEGFQLAFDSVVPQDSGFQPTDPGGVPVAACFPSPAPGEADVGSASRSRAWSDED